MALRARMSQVRCISAVHPTTAVHWGRDRTKAKFTFGGTSSAWLSMALLGTWGSVLSPHRQTHSADKYITETAILAKNAHVSAVFLRHWKARLWLFLHPHYSHSSPRSASSALFLEEPKQIKLLQKFLVGKKAEMEPHISLLVIKTSRTI